MSAHPATRRIIRISVAIGLAAASTAALADMVWPALILETRLFSWWAITVGLVAEYLFVRVFFRRSIQSSVVATLAANAASSLAGVVLIPLAGIVWEFFPGVIYMTLLSWGTFNPITWAATFALACAVNTLIETQVYARGFAWGIGRREFLGIFVANAVSVGVALGSLVMVPPSL